jgi:hypothetical protein
MKIDDNPPSSKIPYDASKDIPEEILRLKNNQGKVDLKPDYLNTPESAPKPNSGPINAGTIDRAARAEVSADLADENVHGQLNISKTTAASTEVPARESVPKHLDDKWIRIDPPSNMVPYPGVDSLYIKRFGISTLEMIHAAMDSNNKTLYLDAISHNVSMDIRDLTTSDLVFVQYMLRIKSYPSSPYKVRWTSRYGNSHISRIAETTLGIKQLDMSKEEYAQWLAKGISFPTVRESEAILDMVQDNGDKNAFLYNHAQYVYLDEPPSKESFNKKIEFLRNADPDFLVEIQDFAAKAEHGVIESIEVTDDQFDPKAAADFLEGQAKSIMTMAESLANDDSLQGIDNSMALMTLTEEASNFAQEAREIRSSLIEEKDENGEVIKKEAYLPRKETIALRTISPQDMFPSGK